MKQHNIFGGVDDTNSKKYRTPKIQDFHIGFEYVEIVVDPARYMNKGFLFKEKVYSLDSPRLFKINKLLDQGKIMVLVK